MLQSRTVSFDVVGRSVYVAWFEVSRSCCWTRRRVVLGWRARLVIYGYAGGAAFYKLTRDHFPGPMDYVSPAASRDAPTPRIANRKRRERIDSSFVSYLSSLRIYKIQLDEKVL